MPVRLPRQLARFNRVVTNPVMGLWAPYLPPWAVVVHHGRRSGTSYRTVVLAFIRGGQIVIALTYGPTDWSRNVLASGEADVEQLGRSYRLRDPRVVAANDRDQLPAGTRWTARIFGQALVGRID